MKLLKFKVTDFRSVDDSGWVETDQVTALIGTNESGKTNVLMPLWKLNPAKDGAIDPIADFPRKRYNEIRAMKKKPIFIRARFALDGDLLNEVSTLLRVAADKVEAVVSRDYDGNYFVDFPDTKAAAPIQPSALRAELAAATKDIQAAATDDDESTLKQAIVTAIELATKLVPQNSSPSIGVEQWAKLSSTLAGVALDDAPQHSVVAARHGQLLKRIEALSADEKDRAAARALVRKNLPAFVYYSNYGNLDSEIFLPHVIENMKRSDLGQKEQAKARTLKVLFDFVRLSPNEIQELGRDVSHQPGTTPTPEQLAEIAATAGRKKERDILLQSAGTELTRRFEEWWKQGTYRFRFAADGNHFRIWVADAKRPEDIELEARSTGLQWFFSFYLVFLVESQDAHQGAVLLLDEPGLSLHPLAQEDLSSFFDGLAETNQLIYTTHSPFMVDPDHLDRARSVYSDSNGVTQVSPDLRAPIDKSDRAKSVYAAYAAVGMSVSKTMLLGCQAVVVEGPSDQHYLSAMKTHLIGKGLLKPGRELLFFPSGGVKGVKAVASIVMGKDEALPYVLVDSDDAGTTFAKQLKSGLYAGDKDKVLAVGDFTKVENAETEDLLPTSLFTKVVDRYLAKPSGTEEDFSDVVVVGKPVVPQVEAYAAKHGIALDEGWKVEVSKRVKTAILRGTEQTASDGAIVDAWSALFSRIVSPAPPEAAP